MKRRRRDRGRRVPSEQSPNLRTRDSSPEAASDRRKNWPVLAYCVILAATAIAAYCRTLHFPLFFDDFLAIRDNLSIRHLKDLGAVLSPPLSLAEESGVSGRPLVNLSFAINYAFGGLNPWGFRVTNVVIHLAAGLALFGILRRTLERVGPGDPTTRFPPPAAVAFAAALLWTVHPLQTESVTCVIQRTETLMGLCYLLTLYSFIRYAGASVGRHVWAALAILFCLLGMAAKEVMVTAPIIVFLYDRTFVSRSLKEAWRRHSRLHVALAATWVLLAFLVVRAGGSRGNSAGFGEGVGVWSYLLTQCRAIVLYLQLSVWPHPLVVDYGTRLVASPAQVWPQAIFLLVLLAGVGWALVARPALGFLGAWFFLILSPSSSVVPLVAQTIAEHRMYLPLASVVVLVVIATSRWLGRWALPFCMALAAALLVGTLQRNEIYRSELRIWSDTVAKQPENERARNNLGNALVLLPGRLNEAVAQYEEALRLNPGYAEAHDNLGLALAQIPGRSNDAIAQYEEALRLKPDFAEAHNNLGVALSKIPGRRNDAIAEYEDALRLKPDVFEAHNNLGNALSKNPEGLIGAIAQYELALSLEPDSAEVLVNLGHALKAVGRTQEAIARYEDALRLKPNYTEAQFQLALVLSSMPGRRDEAESYLEAVLRIQPENERAKRMLGALRQTRP
jgi:tetratricopeptide (TPR) repeat protein